ncbi:MAG: hypothetical protein HZC29_04830, partial [Thaumarchaeota archaeon]|nr:hypothetical protein [Nitrososphaerota archaeon]
MKLPRISSGRVWAKLVKATKESDVSSSLVDRTSLQAYGIEAPRADFVTAWEMYRTIPKFQNTVESIVLDILSRDWYYESDNEALEKQMNDWEETYNTSEIFESIIRQWCITGNHLLGFSDWKPVQMHTILGMKREKDGKPIKYIQQFSGDLSPDYNKGLDASKFCHSKYIEADREAWGLGLYHSLLETWESERGKESKSLAWIHRDVLQLMYKILKKFSSPKVIWGFDNIDKDVFDKDIAPLISSMEEGDSLALSKVPTVTTDTLDGKGRFYEYINDLHKQTDTGLQSSANRLITEPSAMADAREANKKDDSRVLGIMEKIRRLMNDIIIPTVTGEKGTCQFRWGTKDSLELEFPPSLRDALNTGVINKKIARHILTERLRWDIPEEMMKELEEQDQAQPSQEPTDSKIGFNKDNPSEPSDKKKINEEYLKTLK